MTTFTLRPALAGLVAATLLAPIASAVSAEPTFKYSGSVRARYEALSGQSRAGFKLDDQLASLRTIVAGEYDMGLVRVGAELTDSRAYLGDPTSAISSNDVNALEPSQLYVGLDLDQPFGTGSALGAQI